MPKNYLQRILTARVYDVAVETPLECASSLSRRLHNTLWLKREDQQPVFSFKNRGAYNKMVQLSATALKQGVIAASAGNHAQGVALAAAKLGCTATIVMPATTPDIKVNAVRNLQAQVVLAGNTYDEASAHAKQLAEQQHLSYIHPYDDPDVIVGQGTIGMELLKQHPGPLHAVFVPVGGGGLIAGMATYIKQVRPDVLMIGVEPEHAASMTRSLEKKRRITLREVGLFADGVAVKKVGRETFRLARKYVDGMITVSNDEICAAIKDAFEDTRTILEPAGALSIAGAKKYVAEHLIKQQHLVAVTSGANMNFDRLRHVSERTETGERREAILAVTIPERPGSFRNFCSLIGKHNISEFNYRYADSKIAHVYAGIQVRNDTEIDELKARLSNQGYALIDLTDNETAKLHIRHLVGGHAPQVTNEQIVRFQLPERPGALLHLLSCMGKSWNISLFHYRNHGTDFGRVLAGIQVPPGDRPAFNEFLKNMGYPYHDETENPVCKLFLS
ncbi:MAG TPA: threonine ammonia-lyase, biosynthetic [Gammaproteobacteria bacterium]|nr:threonine ammonia-lyase, biosynthetic [Gammaproteobacteria bacterium]